LLSSEPKSPDSGGSVFGFKWNHSVLLQAFLRGCPDAADREPPPDEAHYRVTLAEGGRDRSVILEYDGLEYHTKDPSVVRSPEDFREEYLQYDIHRQLELESYGYRFLRVNKFSLAPLREGQTRVDVLNDLLLRSFDHQEV